MKHDGVIIELRCPKCGAAIPPNVDGKITCQYCDATLELETDNDVDQKMRLVSSLAHAEVRADAEKVISRMRFVFSTVEEMRRTIDDDFIMAYIEIVVGIASDEAYRKCVAKEVMILVNDIIESVEVADSTLFKDDVRQHYEDHIRDLHDKSESFAVDLFQSSEFSKSFTQNKDWKEKVIDNICLIVFFLGVFLFFLALRYIIGG